MTPSFSISDDLLSPYITKLQNGKLRLFFQSFYLRISDHETSLEE